MAQLEGVYDCTYTNWDQVGGTDAPIDLFYPSIGSGTDSFFSGMLGFDPLAPPPNQDDCVSGGTNSPPTEIGENEATQIPAAELADAIMVFSAGSFAAQINPYFKGGAPIEPDETSGFHINQIDGTGDYLVGAGTAASPYSLNPGLVDQKNLQPPFQPTSNTAVQGVRMLFNVIETGSLDYGAANAFVGQSSALCTGKERAIVGSYGFIGLRKCDEGS